jgi:hypothetical protein
MSLYRLGAAILDELAREQAIVDAANDITLTLEDAVAINRHNFRNRGDQNFFKKSVSPPRPKHRRPQSLVRLKGETPRQLPYEQRKLEGLAAVGFRGAARGIFRTGNRPITVNERRLFRGHLRLVEGSLALLLCCGHPFTNSCAYSPLRRSGARDGLTIYRLVFRTTGRTSAEPDSQLPYL